MKVLVIGGGAREHTVVWKLAQSPKVDEIYCAPGNAGTVQLAQNLNISPIDIESLVKVAQEKVIDLVVVGPEAPLAEGIVDSFQDTGIPIFGPSQKAAEIESSKVFAKDLMQKYNLPCARSISFSDYTKATEYIQQQTAPLVVKADGLAAGKGVIIANSIQEALKAITLIMDSKTFGNAGNRVIIEEFLTGNEMSAMSFTDGDIIIPMVAACDYKRVYDNNQGPNTGGMGSYSPPYFFNQPLGDMVQDIILKPAVKAMQKEKRPYKGVLYGGLMVTKEGPKVLEFNARFGDPETQVVLPRLKTDLLDIMLAVANGNLEKAKVDWSEEACMGVVMASGGYPDSYKTGFPISGLDDMDSDIMVFHAGTKTDPDSGQILTSGGRVLTVVATGDSLDEARGKVYTNIPRIHFEGCHYRQDIALV
ncbi:phosphoribosylamine--glycine ligase [Chloroflexota bacterium]